MGENPKIIVIAGCNGAGKSTIAPHLLRDAFGLKDFVNADTIAQGLSAFSPESVALEAGRLMLKRLKDLAKERKSFSFETTLATRFYARWLAELQRNGFEFHLVFLWLESPELACQRVRERVSLGGHNILEDVIYRRYFKGVRNFFELYKSLANSWTIYDNSDFGNPKIIAEGNRNGDKIFNQTIWEKLCKRAE
ncbi:MAG TPA: zeta toxin family protein [Pyrinomonadaceae bacterium]|nr:zeta toxin family protein [Pyrinomonadaceae bacterium]